MGKAQPSLWMSKNTRPFWKLDVLTDIGEAEEDIKKKRFYSSEKALENIRKENQQVKIFWTDKAIERIGEIAPIYRSRQPNGGRAMG